MTRRRHASTRVIGLEVDELVEVGLRTARLPVVPGVCQPMGIVHGGVYAAIAETLASMGTADGVLALGKVPLGMSNNTSFLRPVQRGHGARRGAARSTAVARPGCGTSRCATTTASSARPRGSRSRCATRSHEPTMKIAFGFFSFTEITDPAEHHAYNEWHQLDHLPEQFPLAGIVYGQRWVSTPACRAARAVSEPDARSDPLRHLLPDGRADRGDARRLLRARRASCTGSTGSTGTAARTSPVRSASATRPRRRACWCRPRRCRSARTAASTSIVEELRDRDALADYERWLATSTSPRCWRCPASRACGRSRAREELTSPRWTAGARRITVCWLDDDPLEVAARLAPLEAARRERFDADVARDVRRAVRDDHAVGVGLVRRPVARTIAGATAQMKIAAIATGITSLHEVAQQGVPPGATSAGS